MKYLKLIAILLLLGIIPSAQAGILEFQSYGTNTLSYSARASALGLRGIALPGESPLANPALGALGRDVDAMATMAADWKREVRSREVFDSYSNSVGMNTESVNSHNYLYPASLVVNYAFSPFGSYEKGSPVIAVSFGAASECDYTYDYKKEIRDAFFMLTETYTIKSEGRIMGYTGGASARLFPCLSIGMSGTLLDGNHSIEYQRLYEDPILDDSLSTFSENITGTRLNAGIWAEVGRHLSLAAVYLSGRDIKSDNPDEVVLGLNYNPANYLPANLSLEYSYAAWSKSSNPFNDSTDLYNVGRYSLGLTHKIKDRLPLHFGVTFANSYLNRGIGFASAGLGTELSFSRFDTQVGFTLGRRSFNLGQALGTSDPVNVSEMAAQLTLTFAFK